ncbi:MAG: hypothetical protein ACYSX1_10430 [Planctomycetota bacterium]
MAAPDFRVQVLLAAEVVVDGSDVAVGSAVYPERVCRWRYPGCYRV